MTLTVWVVCVTVLWGWGLWGWGLTTGEGQEEVGEDGSVNSQNHLRMCVVVSTPALQAESTESQRHHILGAPCG